MDINAVVAHYIKLRDEIKALRERHKEELAPMQADMATIEAALHKHMHDQGVQSLKTQAGTPYISEITNIKVTDWEAALQQIINTQQWDLLYRNVAKRAFLDSGKELPGIETSVIQKVNVRRS